MPGWRGLSILLVAMAALAAQPAVAQQAVTVQAPLGLSFRSDAGGAGGGWLAGLPVPTAIEFETGFGTGAGTGFTFTNGFRVEGEITFRRSGLESLRSALLPSDLAGEIGGYSSGWSFMANTRYRIDTGTAFTPYIGAGVGAAAVNFDVGYAGSGTGTSIGSADTRFAYQGIAGVEYDVGGGLGAGVEYRYFATEGAHDPISGPAGMSVGGEAQSHNGYLVIRQRF